MIVRQLPNEIVFATGNSGKVATLKRHLHRSKLPVSIVQRPLELIEPQAHTAAEVAAVKAKQAYALLKRPVLVDDSSFHISALGGFPGPYVKYMLDTVGVAGIMKFMEGKTDRQAYFTSSLVFIDETGVAHAFNAQGKTGRIVETIDTYDHPDAWSELWKIFAPPGQTKTYSQMSKDDLLRLRQTNKDNNAYLQFTQWLEGHEA